MANQPCDSGPRLCGGLSGIRFAPALRLPVGGLPPGSYNELAVHGGRSKVLH